MTETGKPDPALAARHLMRASRAGTLATSDAGQPFASLVTPATAIDGSLLMLLSGLSPHTRHLREETRCSVLLLGKAAGANPQTAPRLTLLGRAAPEADPALKARWVALHPYAAFYAELGDFQLWRLSPERGHYIGGFASAHRLGAAELLPGAAAVAALATAEAPIIAHCNADHADTMNLLAVAHGGAGQGWRMLACDPDGCDLGLAEHTIRVSWPAPAGDAADVRKWLIRLADAARNRIATGAGPSV